MIKRSRTSNATQRTLHVKENKLKQSQVES